MNQVKIDEINAKLLLYQKKWYIDIVKNWVRNSANEQKKKEYFKKKGAIGFSEPFFTSVYETNNNLPKVMFIGQETNGWGDYSKLNEIDNILLSSQRFVSGFTENNIVIRNNHLKIQDSKAYDSHIFWRFIREIYDKSNKPIHVVWTELDKIQYYCGNRYYKLWTEDEKVLNGVVSDGKTMLELEIETIKPEIIVFLTGTNYSQSMEMALQKTNMHIPEKEIFTEFEVLGKICLWTYHPFSLQIKGQWNSVINKIVEMINQEK